MMSVCAGRCYAAGAGGEDERLRGSNDTVKDVLFAV